MIKKLLFLIITGLIIGPMISNLSLNESMITPNNPMDHSLFKINPYTPKFSSFTIKENMTLSPLFTPDNALDLYVYWINKAQISLYIQNPYITQFDNGDWSTDTNPIVKAILQAKNRGVSILVQINKEADSDNITSYFQSMSVPIRWMGGQNNNPDNDYMSKTHNKLVIIDNKTVLLSSINFSENAFLNNREAGIVVENINIAMESSKIFLTDWNDGEIPPTPTSSNKINENAILSVSKVNQVASGYTSHTNIPKTNFTGVYNVTLFTNPDNAEEIIFKYLENAKKSIYVSMYTISNPRFNNTLIELKKSNPSLDIQVLLSKSRVGQYENIDTFQAGKSLVENLIPVFNSSSNLNYYHNKYWLIDGTETFIYSGNWSPRSVSTTSSSYSSSDNNRDMGFAVHEATDVANFFTNEVWKKDIAVANPWELPVGIKQTTLTTADILKGEINVSCIITGLNDTTNYYRWDEEEFIELNSEKTFVLNLNTSELSNGIHKLELKTMTSFNQAFYDSVKINIANYPVSNNWRVLITEILSDPSVVPDSEGEFYEITNSFPFSVLLEGWETGTDSKEFIFPKDYIIDKYSSIIIARNKVGFEGAFSIEPDIDYSFTLKNTEGYVYLKDGSGNFLDVVAYGMSAPDNSESLSPATNGKSLQRIPLHIDTNTKKDFKIDLPTPKVFVPQESLLTNEDPLNSEEVSAPFFSFILSLIAIISYKKIIKYKY